MKCNTYTIYALSDRAGQIKYIGQTQYPLANRLSVHKAKAMNNHNTEFNSLKSRWIRSCGYDITILAMKTANTKTEADNLEKALIFSLSNLGFILTNTNHNPNVSMPQSQRIKLSKAMTGRKHSASTKLKISSAISKPVYQYTKNGTLVKAWFSAIQAERSGEGFSKTSISKCCVGKGKYHKGYIWSFTELDTEQLSIIF
jgi:hypothetical protein